MNKHYIMKALALVMAICCATQWAMAEEKDDGQFVYNTFKADVGAETNADCVEILGFSPSYPDDGGDIELLFKTSRVTIDGVQYYLYRIGKSAFSPYGSRYQTWIEGREMCRRITKLTIRCTSMQQIGDAAFQGCEKLSEVSLFEYTNDHAIKKIGSYAFESTAIDRISLPENVTLIESYCFANTKNLKSINMRNASYIGSHAFYKSGLETVTLCKELRNTIYDSWGIADNAFGSCANLKAVTANRPTPYPISANAFANLPADAVLIVPDGSEDAFAGATGWSAFYNIEGTSLTGKEFDDGTFMYRVLTDDKEYNIHTCEIIGLSPSYTEHGIGWYEAKKQASMQDLMGDWHSFDVVGIGKQAFRYSDLTIANFSTCEYLTYIDDEAFANSKELFSVGFPNSLEWVGEGAFEGCTGLMGMGLPDNVYSIGKRAYAGSGIRGITIPTMTAVIEEETFADCPNLTEVKLPGNMAYVRAYAFSGSALKTVVLNGYLSGDIGEGAFMNCKNLETVVGLAASPGDIPESVFKGVKSGATLYVAEDSYDQYAALTGWTKYLTLKVMNTEGDEFEQNGFRYRVNAFDMAYNNADSERSVELLGFADDNPDQSYVGMADYASHMGMDYAITYVVADAFAGNKNIETVSLPNKMFRIGEGAFKDCSNLRYLYLPEEIYVIGNRSFQNTAVERVELPEYTGRVGVEAFRDCKQLKEIVFNKNIEMVNDDSFHGCTSLHQLDLPNMADVYYGFDAFAESGISVLHIPFNVEEDDFSDGVFRNCKNLRRVQVDIPSPTGIDEAVFEGSYDNAILLVPNGMVGTYMALDGWKNFYPIYDHNGMPTGIENVDSPSTPNTQHPAPFYDLQGRRIENPNKGLYIKEGKKVVVK